jgi:hypothetical protein
VLVSVQTCQTFSGDAEVSRDLPCSTTVPC